MRHLATIAILSALFTVASWSSSSSAAPAAEAAATRESRIQFVRPELPRATVDTSLPQQRGKTTPVPANGDLQAAVNAAKPGDTLLLAAGATYRGPIVLPKKSGEGWVLIETSAAQLPPPGTRITPKDAGLMPKIVTMNNGEPAVRAQEGAHHYRFVGVEFTAAPQVKKVSAIVEITHEGKDLGDVPDQLIFDRVYIHGNPELESQRGITLNTRTAAVI